MYYFTLGTLWSRFSFPHVSCHSHLWDHPFWETAYNMWLSTKTLDNTGYPVNTCFYTPEWVAAERQMMSPWRELVLCAYVQSHALRIRYSSKRRIEKNVKLKCRIAAHTGTERNATACAKQLERHQRVEWVNHQLQPISGKQKEEEKST